MFPVTVRALAGAAVLCVVGIVVTLFAPVADERAAQVLDALGSALTLLGGGLLALLRAADDKET